MPANAANRRRYRDCSPSADRLDRGPAASELPRRERMAARGAECGRGENWWSLFGKGWARRRVLTKRRTTTSERRLATRSTNRSRTIDGCRLSERRATDRAGRRTERARRAEIAGRPAPNGTTVLAV